jgi:rRNA maturation RNase YbeY
LCDEKIKQQAIEFGHSEKAEREYLVIHGLMHLFGYDHMTEEDKKEMRSFEKAALAIYHEKENKKIQKKAEKEKKKEERKDK